MIPPKGHSLASVAVARRDLDAELQTRDRTAGRARVARGDVNAIIGIRSARRLLNPACEGKEGSRNLTGEWRFGTARAEHQGLRGCVPDSPNTIPCLPVMPTTGRDAHGATGLSARTGAHGERSNDGRLQRLLKNLLLVTAVVCWCCCWWWWWQWRCCGCGCCWWR